MGRWKRPKKGWGERLSKAAQKRVRKELLKLLSSGRYWEWLESLEKESLLDEYRKEWQEAWQTLARRAFRNSRQLEEFLTRTSSLKQHPDTPDIRFLFLLREFIEGDSGGEGLISQKGLSFPAEAIRKQAVVWNDEQFSRQKLHDLLTPLISKPEEATKKSYDEIAQLLKGTRLSAVVRSVATQLTTACGLNKWTGIEINRQRLSEIEFALKEASDHLPHHLRMVLFYPILFYISKALQRLVESGKQASVAEWVSSMPFLFSLLAGERAESLRNQLRQIKPETLDYAELDRVTTSGDFEEKVALLGRIRAFHREDDVGKGALDYLGPLYKSIFSDIGRMRQSLSEREKKDLNRAIGSALKRDLQLLWNGLGFSEHDLLGILIPAAETGCFDQRLAMLSLVLAEKQSNRRLKILAENCLRNLDSPSRDDILWVVDEFSEMIFPHIGSLKPLLFFWGEEAPFIGEVAQEIWFKALALLALNSVSKKMGRFFPFPEDRPFDDGAKGNIRILRREVSALKGCKPFAIVAESLDCFPEDSFDEKGFRRLLDKAFERGKGLDAVIEMMEASLRQASIAKGKSDFFTISPLDDYFKILERGFYDFLREHWDALKTSRLENIDRLIHILMMKGTQSYNRNLLTRVSNLLEERFRAGEEGAGRLKERLMGELLRQRPKSKPAAGRKKREKPGRALPGLDLEQKMESRDRP